MFTRAICQRVYGVCCCTLPETQCNSMGCRSSAHLHCSHTLESARASAPSSCILPPLPCAAPQLWLLPMHSAAAPHTWGVGGVDVGEPAHKAQAGLRVCMHGS